jgi:Spy/CpxP family protein refolding chaperone
VTPFANDVHSLESSGSATLDLKLPAPRSNRVRKWIPVLMAVAIFAAGVICGAAVVRLSTKAKPLGNWNDLLSRVARRMQRDLDLTESQRTSVEGIMQAHQPQLDRIHARTVTEMRSELQQVIEELSAVLTPEQARRFRSEAQPRLDEHFPPVDAGGRSQPLSK